MKNEKEKKKQRKPPPSPSLHSLKPVTPLSNSRWATTDINSISHTTTPHNSFKGNPTGGFCGLFPPAVTLFNPIPTPSMTASRHAHPIALFLAALTPPLTARAPPVKNPAIIALYGSSFCRTPLTAQSKVENRPPQTPKLPPRTGARAFIDVSAPMERSPLGEFLKPFTPCQIAPPTA